jgi:hypothetical protein
MGFKSKSTVIYKVWSLDTVGSDCDGWTVNNRRQVGVVSVRTDRQSKSGEWHTSNAAITRGLVEDDYLQSWVTAKNLSIEGEDDGVLFIEDSDTGEPVLQLEYLRHHDAPEQKSPGLFGEPAGTGERSADYAQKNPDSGNGFWTPTTMILAGLGVITLGAIGYGAWKNYSQQQQALSQNQNPALPPASGNAPASYPPSNGSQTPQEIADQQDQVPPFVSGT